MTIWFTADTHFCYPPILEASQRPFRTIGEHDEALVENWNSRVQPHDTVWHLGDFSSTTDQQRVEKLFSRLHGTKHLVIGNHDEKWELALHLPWASMAQIVRLKAEGHKLCLCHYPMRSWMGTRSGTVQLYGHMHGVLAGDSRSLDVGVDCWDYQPVALDEIMRTLKTLPERLDM